MREDFNWLVGGMSPTHHQLGCKLAKINLQVMPTLPPNPNDTRNPNDPTEGSPPLYHYHKSPECLPPFKVKQGKVFFIP